MRRSRWLHDAANKFARSVRAGHASRLHETISLNDRSTEWML